MAFAAPLGTEEFIAAHARCFPGQEDGIRKLMALCSTMNREVREMSMAAFAQAPERFANLFRYRRATLAAVLDEYVTDYRLKSLLGAIWPYAGLPPSRLSFLYWSLTLMSFIERGVLIAGAPFRVWRMRLSPRWSNGAANCCCGPACGAFRS